MLEGKISTNLVVYYKTKAKSIKAMIYFHLLKNHPILQQIPFLNRNCCRSKTIRVLMGYQIDIYQYSPFWTNPKKEIEYHCQFLLKKICLN